jgi:hypothetical protein
LVLLTLYQLIEEGWLKINDKVLNKALHELVRHHTYNVPTLSCQPQPLQGEDTLFDTSSNSDNGTNKNEVILLHSIRNPVTSEALKSALMDEGALRAVPWQVPRKLKGSKAGHAVSFSTKAQANALAKKLMTTHWLILGGGVVEPYLNN